MRYAVIASGGKQYKVSEGDVIDVEKLAVVANDPISLDQVLLSVTDEAISIGKPLVAGAVVKGTVVEQRKGEKIRVAKFKAKVRYRRVTGKRQHLTRIKIDSIVIPGEKEQNVTKVAPKDTKPTRTVKNKA